MKKYFGPLKLRAIDENLVWLSGDNSKEDEAVAEADKASRVYWNAMNPIIGEMSDALKLYLTELNKFLRPGELPNIPKGMFSQD